MKKSTTYIVVAVVIVIIIIAAAAAYVYMNPSEGGATPTPTATATPTVVGQSTLQFNVNETSTNGAEVTYEYSFANLTWDGNTVNAANTVVRLDLPGGSAGNYSYILNAAEEKSWLSLDNGATWTVDDFQTDWTTWSPFFSDYISQLATNWNGSDLTYTYTASSGATNLIYDICPGPTLPDSLFTAS
jgi:hypothetical protein